MSDEKKFAWIVVGVLAVLAIVAVLWRGIYGGGVAGETSPIAEPGVSKVIVSQRPAGRTVARPVGSNEAVAAKAKPVVVTDVAPAPKRGELGDPSHRVVATPPPAIPRNIREELDPGKRAELVAKHRVEIARATLAISRRRVRLLKATIEREKEAGEADSTRSAALAVELKLAEASAAAADNALEKLLAPDAGAGRHDEH